jgi:aminoglycoside phosphotransferase (APT) family kinase protein
MDFVQGAILRDRSEGEKLDVAARKHAGDQIADVLARIHAVDVDAVGLGDLGRKEAYLERQLKRWHRQWEQSKTRDLPVVDEVHAELVTRQPTQHGATIVHGDYRLDNCLVAPDGSIAAVLDWELCTLGDPLADVGLLLVYWSDRDGPGGALGEAAATVLDGFPTRAELRTGYEAASGRDLSEIDYYVAFGYWKLACILEGVLARYRAGVMGESDGYQPFAQQVEVLAEAARTTIEAMA